MGSVASCLNDGGQTFSLRRGDAEWSKPAVDSIVRQYLEDAKEIHGASPPPPSVPSSPHSVPYSVAADDDVGGERCDAPFSFTVDTLQSMRAWSPQPQQPSSPFLSSPPPFEGDIAAYVTRHGYTIGDTDRILRGAQLIASLGDDSDGDVRGAQRGAAHQRPPSGGRSALKAFGAPETRDALLALLKKSANDETILWMSNAIISVGGGGEPGRDGVAGEEMGHNLKTYAIPAVCEALIGLGMKTSHGHAAMAVCRAIAAMSQATSESRQLYLTASPSIAAMWLRLGRVCSTSTEATRHWLRVPLTLFDAAASSSSSGERRIRGSSVGEAAEAVTPSRSKALLQALFGTTPCRDALCAAAPAACRSPRCALEAARLITLLLEDQREAVERFSTDDVRHAIERLSRSCVRSSSPSSHVSSGVETSPQRRRRGSSSSSSDEYDADNGDGRPLSAPSQRYDAVRDEVIGAMCRTLRALAVWRVGADLLLSPVENAERTIRLLLRFSKACGTAAAAGAICDALRCLTHGGRRLGESVAYGAPADDVLDGRVAVSGGHLVVDVLMLLAPLCALEDHAVCSWCFVMSNVVQIRHLRDSELFSQRGVHALCLVAEGVRSPYASRWWCSVAINLCRWMPPRTSASPRASNAFDGTCLPPLDVVASDPFVMHSPRDRRTALASETLVPPLCSVSLRRAFCRRISPQAAKHPVALLWAAQLLHTIVSKFESYRRVWLHRDVAMAFALQLTVSEDHLCLCSTLHALAQTLCILSRPLISDGCGELDVDVDEVGDILTVSANHEVSRVLATAAIREAWVRLGAACCSMASVTSRSVAIRDLPLSRTSLDDIDGSCDVEHGRELAMEWQSAVDDDVGCPFSARDVSCQLLVALHNITFGDDAHRLLFAACRPLLTVVMRMGRDVIPSKHGREGGGNSHDGDGAVAWCALMASFSSADECRGAVAVTGLLLKEAIVRMCSIAERHNEVCHLLGTAISRLALHGDVKVMLGGSSSARRAILAVCRSPATLSASEHSARWCDVLRLLLQYDVAANQMVHDLTVRDTLAAMARACQTAASVQRWCLVMASILRRASVVAKTSSVTENAAAGSTAVPLSQSPATLYACGHVRTALVRVVKSINRYQTSHDGSVHDVNEAAVTLCRVLRLLLAADASHHVYFASYAPLKSSLVGLLQWVAQKQPHDEAVRWALDMFS